MQTAALVGERTIRTVDYQRVLAGVEGDLRSPIDDAMRRRVLDRMVDEELLVQRALQLGLAVVDRRVRGELTSGLIDSIVSEADADEISERDVQRHYEESLDFFTRPGRLRAETLFFSSRRPVEDDATPALDGNTVAPERARAEEARRRLIASAEASRAARDDRNAQPGENPMEIARALSDRQVSPVPNALLPASKLRDYVGPAILKAIMELEIGEWSEPLTAPGGVYLARLLEREPSVVPELAEIEELVRQDLRRRKGDDALRRYLDDLRAQIDVTINDAVFVQDAQPGEEESQEARE